LLGRYEIRWETKREPNDRTQTITVHNNGTVALSNVRIHLTVTSNKPDPVADFAFGRPGSGPQVSLFDSIASSESTPIPPPSEQDKLRSVLDPHSDSRTLFAIDHTFDDMLSSRLRGNKQLNGLLPKVAANRYHSEWHRVLLEECSQHKVSPAICQQGEPIFQGWEIGRRELLEKGRKRWQETIGVKFWSDNGALMPSGNSNFTFDLGGNESCVLKVYYNTDPSMAISAEAEVLSGSVAKTNQVSAPADLNLPLPMFMLQYHLNSVAGLVIIALAALMFAWPVIRPKQLLPIHKVFKIALNTDDHEYWEHAYQRCRFFVLQQFRDLRSIADRPNLNPEPEELLDYVRNCLITVYANDPSELGSDRKLERVIRTQLKFLVAAAPP
jgi:hypothetical protein